MFERPLCPLPSPLDGVAVSRMRSRVKRFHGSPNLPKMVHFTPCQRCFTHGAASSTFLLLGRTHASAAPAAPLRPPRRCAGPCVRPRERESTHPSNQYLTRARRPPLTRRGRCRHHLQQRAVERASEEGDAGLGGAAGDDAGVRRVHGDREADITRTGRHARRRRRPHRQRHEL